MAGTLKAVRKKDKIEISRVVGRDDASEMVEKMHKDGTWPEKHSGILYDDNTGVIWLYCMHDRDWIPLN